MWIYLQDTGELIRNGQVAGTGYSGFGAGKNNPALSNVPDIGPIPCGLYGIGGPPYRTTEHGPDVLTLTPRAENQMFGRSGFLIHGDSISSPGQASTGCIVIKRLTRLAVWDSQDLTLCVLPAAESEAKA